MTVRPKWLVSGSSALLLLVSGCARMRPAAPPARLVKGAVIGTVAGAAIGCGIAASIDRDDPTTYVIGCGSGALAGAVAGAAVADLTYHRPPPPPRVVQAPPPPPPAPPPPKPREKLVLRGVHFNFNKANIRPDDEPVLDEAVRILKEEPDVRLYVDGYCDAIGSDEYNEELSARRSGSVASYMERAGISSGRLIPRGFGKTHFVASNDTAEGRAQNRRVELVPVE